MAKRTGVKEELKGGGTMGRDKGEGLRGGSRGRDKGEGQGGGTRELTAIRSYFIFFAWQNSRSQRLQMFSTPSEFMPLSHLRVKLGNEARGEARERGGDGIIGGAKDCVAISGNGDGAELGQGSRTSRGRWGQAGSSKI